MTPAFSAMFGLARVPQCHCRGETGRVGFPRLLDGRGGCGCRCLGHSISSEWCAGAGGRCSRRAGAARWPRPVRQHCDSCHGGQGASQPANTRKVLQTSVRTVRNSGGEGENLRLHAEIASDAPLAHERQKVRQKQHGSVRRGMRAAHTRSWRATGTRLGQAAAVCPRRAGARRGARVRGRSRALRG